MFATDFAVSETFTGLNIPPALKHSTVLQLERFAKTNPDVVSAEVLDSLLAMCFIPGYADQARGALREWAFAEIRASLADNGVMAYHKHAPLLQWIHTHLKNDDLRLLAKDAMNELYLSQSASTPDKWWVDTMTGEEDPEALEEFKTNVAAQVVLKGDAEAFNALIADILSDREKIERTYEGRTAPYTDHSGDSLALSIRQAYGDPAMTELALKAAYSSLGDLPVWDDQTEDFGEDRSYTPPPLVKDYDPDMGVIDWDVVARFKKAKSAVWKVCFYQEPRNIEKREALIVPIWAGLYEGVKQEFLGALKVWERADVQAAATVVYPLIDELFLSEDEIPDTVLQAIEDFEDDIANRADGMRKAGEWNDVIAIDKFTERFTQDMSATLPLMNADPTKTRSWNGAFIAAISAGATNDEATGAAWAEWRRVMSKTGAAAYNAQMAATHDTKTAWAKFWAVCPKFVPRSRDTILSVSDKGMKIMSTTGHQREINYGIALMKLKAGELNLEKKAKLIAVLEEKKWPYATKFLRELKAMQ